MKSLALLLFLSANIAYAAVTTHYAIARDTAKTKLATDEKDTIECDLHDQKFGADGDFSGQTFPQPAKFYGATFNGDAVFKECVFKDFVDFSSTRFHNDITFSFCKFNKFLFMSDIRADTVSVFYFYNAVLPELIDFSHNRNLPALVDYTDADFDSPVTEQTPFADRCVFINIFNSDISKLGLDYLHFRLCFYDPKQGDKGLKDIFMRLKKKYIKSSTVTEPAGVDSICSELLGSPLYQRYISVIFPAVSMDDSLVTNFTHFYVFRGTFMPARLGKDQIEALYSSLLKNFSTSGQQDSYELLDVEYQDYVWSKRFGLINWIYIFPKYWNYYGHRKEWIFGWTVLFMVVFTTINYLLYKSLFDQSDKKANAYHLVRISETEPGARYPRLSKLKYAFFYTSLIFFSFSIDADNLNFTRATIFYIVIINVLGLLCLGYLANFILAK